MNPTITFRILLFAGVRDAARRDAIEVAVGSPATAAELIDAIAGQIPDAAALIGVSRLAVGGQYVASDHVIEQPDVEIALIPPVSGG